MKLTWYTTFSNLLIISSTSALPCSLACGDAGNSVRALTEMIIGSDTLVPLVSYHDHIVASSPHLLMFGEGFVASDMSNHSLFFHLIEL